MRITLLLFIFCFGLLSSYGQTKHSTTKKHAPGKQHLVSAAIHLPFGEFSDTHIGGLAVEYAWSDHRFGRQPSLPSKKIGFLATGGVAYYFGEKETVNGYPYDYPGYLFIHIYPGLVFNVDKKLAISLAAGPGLGIYNGTTRFNLGAVVQVSYSISERIAISPGILLMKENGADPLIAASVKSSWSF
ncbi:MAG: hypothetical protein ABIR30_05625 [Chitinophagaceae bacterium]